MRRPLVQAGQRVEGISALDRVGRPAHDVAAKLIKTGSAKDLLSGTWLGHPLHPVMVGVPIGSWVSASILDLGSQEYAAAARRLVGLGVVTALPTALAGLTDWTDTSGAEQRVGTLHALLNLTAVALYGGSWLARRKRTRGAGKVLALAGGAVMAAAGYLGGHLSYSLGVGVDTNAFQTGPDEWQAVGPESDLTAESPVAVEVGGVSIVIVKFDGRLHALANRCSHRGGPLSDGEARGNCISCPWHGSQFEIDSGQVARGPATHPQPVYEVRVVDGQLCLRRSEVRSLRTNPVSVG